MLIKPVKCNIITMLCFFSDVIGDDKMSEQIEYLRKKLDDLVANECTLYEGEILRLSQELDKLIYKYYLSTRSA